MYPLSSLALLYMVLVSPTGASYHGTPEQGFTTMQVPPRAHPDMKADEPRHMTSVAGQQVRDAFDFDVRSDQIVLMMDGLADVSARIAETRDPDFHKKEEDDAPPFKCHCKCSLLGGCECWCGDQDNKTGSRS